MGIVFLVLSAFDYKEHLQDVTPQTNAYGSIFYTIMTFHVAHVCLGSLDADFRVDASEIGAAAVAALPTLSQRHVCIGTSSISCGCLSCHFFTSLRIFVEYACTNHSVRSVRDLIPPGRLWFGAAGAAVAWAVQGFTCFEIATQACADGTGTGDRSRRRRPDFNWLCDRRISGRRGRRGHCILPNWRSLAESRELMQAEGTGREEYMALVGVYVGATCVVGLIWAGIPPIFLNVCNTNPVDTIAQVHPSARGSPDGSIAAAGFVHWRQRGARILRVVRAAMRRAARR